MGSDRGFQLVIRAKFESGYKYLHLDTCMEKNINSSAQIPMQPLQNGDTIGDHMYRNPTEFTVSGVFSLYGMNADNKDYTNITGIKDQGDRLSNIQTVFEYIKDNGILCDLITLDESNSGATRFKVRNSMALQNISWKEHQASAAYTFTFREIISVQVEQITIEADEDLPEVYLPSTRSLGEVLFMNDSTSSSANNQKTSDYNLDPYIKNICNVLVSNKSISYATVLYLNKLGTNYTQIGLLNSQIALLQYIGTLVDTSEKLYAIDESLKRQNIISYFIYNLFNPVKKTITLVNNLNKYGTDTQKALNDSTVKINIENVNKLENLLNNVKDAIIKVSSDVQVYTISSGKTDNNERDVPLFIGNKIYYIRFYKDSNSVYGWNTNITTAGYNGDESLDGTNGLLVNSFCPCINVSFMSRNTSCMFIDSTGLYEVYLYAPSLEGGLSTEEKKYLYRYSLLVSKGNIQNSIQNINNIISNILKSEGYL